MAEGETTQFTVSSEVESPKLRGPTLIPFLSFFPEPQFKFPFGKQERKAERVVAEEYSRTMNVEEDYETSKPDVVRVPGAKPEFPSVKLESDESEHASNPLVLWQVYALGGFMILQWAWAKWQERKNKTKKGSSNEDHSPSND